MGKLREREGSIYGGFGVVVVCFLLVVRRARAVIDVEQSDLGQ
jgi:hypothetical protein